MSSRPATLRRDAEHEWLVGGYYRAYALHKDDAHLDAARELLTHLRETARDAADPDSMLRERIERLHGQVLIRMRNAEGRRELIDLFDRLGGRKASAAGEAKEHARLLSDLSRDLTVIGRHDDAVELTRRLLERKVESELLALRLTNLAAWLLQRAVAFRVGGEKRKAEQDLNEAMESVTRARKERVAAQEEHGHDQSLELRECEAVRVSIDIERAALHPTDLSETIKRMVALLGQTPNFDEAPETRLQLAYRIGRLGVAHSLSTSSTSADRERGLAYLRYAWDFTGKQLVRPWLPLYLTEALRPAEDRRRFASAALERLLPQAGPNYVVNRELKAISSERSGSKRRSSR